MDLILDLNNFDLKWLFLNYIVKIIDSIDVLYEFCTNEKKQQRGISQHLLRPCCVSPFRRPLMAPVCFLLQIIVRVPVAAIERVLSPCSSLPLNWVERESHLGRRPMSLVTITKRQVVVRVQQHHTGADEL